MATNNFNSDGDNESISPLRTFSDGSGLARLDNINISSYAFDGAVPDTTVNIVAASISPGMKVSFTGSALGETFYRVISNTNSNSDFESNDTGQVLIEYLDENKNIESFTASVSDIFSVNYEDWNNKYLGTKGWYLSNDGNAIFSNVAVRGRVEATEGAIEGDLTLGGSLTASTNLGFVQLSASGIFGTTSSGQFHLDTTTGEIDITGNINANSGQIKTLNIGPTQYPIFNIFGVFTSSATTSASDSGQFILVTPIYKDYTYPPGGGPAGQVYNKKLIPGDVFKLQNTQTTSSCVIEYYTPVGASAMFNTGAKVQPDDTGPWAYQDNKFIVLSASYGQSDFSYMSIGPYAVYVNKYHCKYHWYPDNFPLQIDFNGVTTASGSFNIGYLSFVASQESVFKTSNGFESRTSIDGIVLANYRKKITNYSLGDFLQVPDYIDLGGTFKLGNGNITFDGDNLSIIGNINATGGNISGDLSLGGSLTASTNNGQLIISSSGIFGSTASGYFHLDNIDREITFSGKVIANSGEINELNIGDKHKIKTIVGLDDNLIAIHGYDSFTNLNIDDYIYMNEYISNSPISASLARFSWRLTGVGSSLTTASFYGVSGGMFPLTQNFSKMVASGGYYTGNIILLGTNLVGADQAVKGDGLIIDKVPSPNWSVIIERLDHIFTNGKIRFANGKISYWPKDSSPINGNALADIVNIYNSSMYDSYQIYLGDRKTTASNILGYIASRPMRPSASENSDVITASIGNWVIGDQSGVFSSSNHWSLLGNGLAGFTNIEIYSSSVTGPFGQSRYKSASAHNSFITTHYNNGLVVDTTFGKLNMRGSPYLYPGLSVDISSASVLSINTSGTAKSASMTSSMHIYQLGVYNDAAAGTANLIITANGQIMRNVSTQKIKNNIIELNGSLSGVDQNKIINSPPDFNYKDILQICPVQFTEINTGKKYVGFIAEDIYEKIPLLSIKSNTDEVEYFDITGVVASILSVVKDQQNAIDDLKNRVLQLESQQGG